MAQPSRSRIVHLPVYYWDILLVAILMIVLLLNAIGILGQFNELILAGTSMVALAPVLLGVGRAWSNREWISMDMLASIALGFSIINQQWVSAIFIGMMLTAARILSELTNARAQRSIQSLLKLRPATAKVQKEGSIAVVPVESLALDDIVVVDVGDRIPVDGVVALGTGSVDESSLTGESLPVDKTIGSIVSSSTLIASGSLHIRTRRIGKDTTFEKIIALVESSKTEKPKTQTLGERFGKFYLVGIFISSTLLLLVTHNTSLVLAVVLVVCADDIAIAIPIAYLRGIGQAARKGIVVKGSRYLEALGNSKIIVFDKTGTLTTGILTVSKIIAVQGAKQLDVINHAAIASRSSNHPLSHSIVSHSAKLGQKAVSPQSAKTLSGKGIVATTTEGRVLVGKDYLLADYEVDIPKQLRKLAEARSDLGESISYVALNEKVVGVIAMADQVKPNARQTIGELKDLGYRRIVMLSGDNERVAKHIAKQVGITDCYANLLPGEKVNQLKKLRRSGALVMVGDGVNDAASLAVADVGIAMGALGSDGAIESADIVLMRDDLSTIPEAVHLAREIERISVQNFWIWGITNVFGLLLVFTGIIGPTGAAVYNFVSDFFPLGNSMRVTSSKA